MRPTLEVSVFFVEDQYGTLLVRWPGEREMWIAGRPFFVTSRAPSRRSPSFRLGSREPRSDKSPRLITLGGGPELTQTGREIFALIRTPPNTAFVDALTDALELENVQLSPSE